MKSREVWEEESVLPDDVSFEEGTDDRYWSPELGGCEGILLSRETEIEGSDKKSSTGSTNTINEGGEPCIVEREEIVSKMRAAKKHWKRFPVNDIKESTWYL